MQPSGKDPQVVLSRAHPDMIKKLFSMEVPELAAGTVELKVIAREAGVRSKVAVLSHQDAIDPVRSLVGRRGVRVQAVMAEIGEEKIDIVLWDADPKTFITNALAPAKVREVELSEATHTAKIKVDSDQLSLAIGKAGQNVRLASKLTGYQIEIDKEGIPPMEAVVAEAEKLTENIEIPLEETAAESTEAAASETAETSSEPAIEPEGDTTATGEAEA